MNTFPEQETEVAALLQLVVVRTEELQLALLNAGDALPVPNHARLRLDASLEDLLGDVVPVADAMRERIDARQEQG